MTRRPFSHSARGPRLFLALILIPISYTLLPPASAQFAPVIASAALVEATNEISVETRAREFMFGGEVGGPPRGVLSSKEISLKIRCTKEVVKVGGEIPIEFLISNLGTHDWLFDIGIDEPRVGQFGYQLSVKKKNGDSLPNLIPNLNENRWGRQFVLHPGEYFTKIIILNRRALLKEAGRSEVRANYRGEYNTGANFVEVGSAPLALTVLPRSDAEMAGYITDLTNHVMSVLGRGPAPTELQINGELTDLVLKLMYTCRPEIVPALLRVLRDRGWEELPDGSTRFNGSTEAYQLGEDVKEAVLYYVPHSAEAEKYILDFISNTGSIGNLDWLVRQYGLKNEDLKPLIARALAAPTDDLGEWGSGAKLATGVCYDDSFTPRLIAIATNSNVGVASRSAAIQALARNRTDAGVRALRTLLNDPDQNIWIPLANALRSGYQPGVKSPSGRHLQPSDFDSADVRPLLLRMLVSSVINDKFYGAELAKHFGDDALTPALIDMATSSEASYNRLAIATLALNRNDEALQTLKKLLNSPEPNIALATAEAIRDAYTSRGDARGRPLLPGDFHLLPGDFAPEQGAPIPKPRSSDLR